MMVNSVLVDTHRNVGGGPKNMRPLVFIPEPIATSGLELLKGVCECLAPWKSGTDSDFAGNGNEHRELLYEADAVIVRLFQITDTDLQRVERLRIIS